MISSLMNLSCVTAMLTVFSLTLPEFAVTSVGKIFAVCWGSFAVLVMAAHADKLKSRRNNRTNS